MLTHDSYSWRMRTRTQCSLRKVFRISFASCQAKMSSIHPGKLVRFHNQNTQVFTLSTLLGQIIKTKINHFRLSILRFYNWTRVGTLYQNEAKYALVSWYDSIFYRYHTQQLQCTLHFYIQLNLYLWSMCQVLFHLLILFYIFHTFRFLSNLIIVINKDTEALSLEVRS